MSDFHFHPDVVDMMAAIGISFEQFRALYRTAWAVASRHQSPDRRPTSADVADPSVAKLIERSEARHARDKAYSATRRANERAAKAVKSADAVPASSDRRPTSADANRPSLSKNLDSDLNQRERGKRGTGKRDQRVPLPADWSPDDETRQLAIDRLGDAAEACLAKFRDHHAHSGVEQTPKGWQGQARKWIRNERVLGAQRSLPLMTAVAPAPAPPADPLWQPVYAQLAADHGENVAQSWFRLCRLAIDGDTAMISVPTKFLASYLTANYEGPIQRAVQAAHAAVTRVRFVAMAASGNLPAASPAVLEPRPLADTG